MLTTSDARRAGGEHGQQRGQPLERGAVADRRRHGDHEPVGQPGDDAGQRAVHAGHDDDHVGRREVRGDGQHPVHAGHPDVVHPARQPTPLAASVAATSAATAPSDVPAVSTAPPTGGGQLPTHAHRGHRRRRARRATAPAPRLPSASSTRVAQARAAPPSSRPARQATVSRRRLAAGEDHLGGPGAGGAVEVQPGEAEVGGARLVGHAHQSSPHPPCWPSPELGRDAAMSVVKINAVTRAGGQAGPLRGAVPGPRRRRRDHPGLRVVRAAPPAGGHRPYLSTPGGSNEEAYQAWQSGQDFDRAHDGGGDTLAPAAERSQNHLWSYEVAGARRCPKGQLNATGGSRPQRRRRRRRRRSAGGAAVGVRTNSADDSCESGPGPPPAGSAPPARRPPAGCPAAARARVFAVRHRDDRVPPAPDQQQRQGRGQVQPVGRAAPAARGRRSPSARSCTNAARASASANVARPGRPPAPSAGGVSRCSGRSSRAAARAA